MLTDAGPLLAILDEDDRQHSATLAIMKNLPGVVLQTTWPCFTEAMFLLGDVGGHRYQERLWRLRRDGRLTLLVVSTADADRMDALMSEYADTPMDLADASLIAVAESRAMRRIFTLDSDFYVYRLSDGSVLEVVR